MITVDAPGLQDLVSTRKGAQIVTITSRTIPTLTGGMSNPLHGRIEKISVVNGIVNWSYENAVNNQRMRESTPLVPVAIVGEQHIPADEFIKQAAASGQTFDEVSFDMEVEMFKAHPRKWGQRIAKSAFVRHIKAIRKNVNEKRVYLELKVEKSVSHQYMVDGIPVDDDVVRGSLPPEYEGRQGVEKKIILRDYQLCNIELIKIGGETYRVSVTRHGEEDLYDQLG